MHRVVHAVLWEIWGAHRAVFGVVLALLPLAALAATRVSNPETAETAALLAYVPLSFSLLGLFAVFNFTEPSAQHKLAVFPVRLFHLPAATLVLVATPMISGALAAAAIYLGWARLVFHPLGRPLPILTPTLLLVVGFLAYQTVMWSLARFRLLRLFVCGVLGALLLWLLVLPEMFLPRSLVEAGAGLPLWPVLAGFGTVAGAALAVAWRCVDRQRHVRTTGRLAMSPARRAGELSAQVHAFPSTARAQFWLEWRRNGLVLPACAVAFAGLLVVGVPQILDPEPRAIANVVVWTLLFAFAAASLLGKGFAVVDFWSRELALTPFIAVRPVTAGDFVFAKYRVAAASAGLTAGVLVLALGVCLAVWPETAQLRLSAEGWVGEAIARSPWTVGVSSAAMLVLLMWRQLIVSTWLGLYGRITVFVVAVLVSFALTLVALPWWGSWFLLERYRLMPTLNWQLGVAVLTGLFVLKLGLASVVWIQSRARGRVSTRQLLAYWIFWLLATSWVVSWASLVVSGYEWLRGVLELGALLAIPLLRPGLAPLALAANRHRRAGAGELQGWKTAGPARCRSRDGLTISWTLGASTLLLTAAALGFASTVWRAVPRQVDAGGTRLRLLTTGRGSPTIVLESDLKDIIERWAPVQNALSAHTSVVAYDRGGRGGSEDSPASRSPREAAQKLRTALRSAGIDPPFVLVASRIGCAVARNFAKLHPADVAALVLLDPEQGETSEEAMDWLRRERAELMPRFQEKIRAAGMAEIQKFVIHELKHVEVTTADLPEATREDVRRRAWDVLVDVVYLKSYHYSRSSAGTREEYRAFDQWILEDRAAWPPPPVPIVVFSGTRVGRAGTLERESLSEPRALAKVERQRRWVEQTPGARLLVTDRSGDDFLTDAPELIVSTVEEVLRQVRAGARSGAGAATR